MLITRCSRRESPRGFSTGVPSIGTMTAGFRLTITRGGVLSTAIGGTLMPAAASAASIRSSEIVLVAAATRLPSSAAKPAPRSGSSGKSLL